jgi:hypothetical protein
VEILTMCELVEIVLAHKRSIVAFAQIVELEVMTGTERDVACVRGMCAVIEQFERELLELLGSAECDG